MPANSPKAFMIKRPRWLVYRRVSTVILGVLSILLGYVITLTCTLCP